MKWADLHKLTYLEQELLQYPFRYLQEVGYTDTILDVRSSRVRSILGLSVADSAPDHPQPNGMPSINRGQDFVVIEDHVRSPKRNDSNSFTKLTEEEADGIHSAPSGKRYVMAGSEVAPSWSPV